MHGGEAGILKTDEGFSTRRRPGKKTVPARKSEHIRICLDEDVSFEKTTGFETYALIHNALPEMDFSEINCSVDFLGKHFLLPVFIEGMTGGAPASVSINENLAKAAEQCGIGMGIGSQRAMLLDERLTGTYAIRHMAPRIFLAGNIGATQLKEFSVDRIRLAVERIEADAIAVHLNAAQELCQPEGDTDWRNVLTAIKTLCRAVNFPVIVKETGFGISGIIARQLEDAGVSCIDTAGAGGTSWARVERFRGSKRAGLFLEWGIPTADALVECVREVRIPVIASGGIQNGVEIVKALALGASLVGMAMPFLKPAVTSAADVVEKIKSLKEEITAAMFLIGAKCIRDIDASKIRRLPGYR